MSTRDLICHDWHPTLRPNDGGYIPMAMDSGAALVARGPMRAGRRQGLDTELPPVPRETEPQYTPVPEEEEQDPQQELMDLLGDWLDPADVIEMLRNKGLDDDQPGACPGALGCDGCDHDGPRRRASATRRHGRRTRYATHGALAVA